MADCDCIKIIDGVLHMNSTCSSCRKYVPTLQLFPRPFSNAEYTRSFIASGSDLNTLSHEEETPLMNAVRAGCKASVRLLLEAGANINITNAKGQSILYIVLHNNVDFEIIEIVLVKAKSEAATIEALIEKLLVAECSFPDAVHWRDINVLKALLERGFDVNSRGAKKRSALHLAVMINDIGLANFLLNCGAEIDAYDCKIWTPLHYAVDQSNPAMLQLLIDRGASVEPDNFNYDIDQPLYISFIVDKNKNAEQAIECSELLLQHGAFPNYPASYIDGVPDKILRSSRLNCLIAHSAMLEMLGIANCRKEEHLTTLSRLKNRYAECQKILELEILPNTALIDLLRYNEREMILRVRGGETFAHEVQPILRAKLKLKKLYSYYLKIVMKRIDKAVYVVELQNKAVSVICTLFDCDYNKLYIFARQVVDYLNVCDLEQLCRV